MNGQTVNKNGIQTVNLDMFLTYSAALIRTYGYVSGQDARTQGTESTGELAWKWATEGKGDERIKNIFLIPEDKHTAQMTKNFFGEDRGKTDYMLKVKAIMARGEVGEREVNYISSSVSVYNKENYKTLTGKIQGNGQGNGQGKHLGRVGEKFSGEVKYVRLGAYESRYGETFIYNFEDREGNKLSWSTQKTKFELGIEIGDILTITGTVKKLSEWKGIRQTELSRCTIRK